MSEAVVDLTQERRCKNCAHPRREHVFWSTLFPSLCGHREDTETEGWYGCCPCLEFVGEAARDAD